MTINHNKKPDAHSVRGRGRPSREAETNLMINTKNPVSDIAAGGSKGRSLRQFSNSMAKAGYWSSRKAGSVDTEGDRIYGRLHSKLDSKTGFKTLTFDELWSAIKSCKLELNSWVSKNDVLNVYLGRPPLVLVYKDKDTLVYKRLGGQQND